LKLPAKRITTSEASSERPHPMFGHHRIWKRFDRGAGSCSGVNGSQRSTKLAPPRKAERCRQLKPDGRGPRLSGHKAPTMKTEGTTAKRR
jgi:hypothetical protein